MFASRKARTLEWTRRLALGLVLGLALAFAVTLRWLLHRAGPT